MASRNVSAGRILEVLASGRSALRGRDERVVVRVHVDPDCPREVALAVKGALVPERPGVVVEVLGLRQQAPAGELPDVAVVLVGPASCAALVESYARAGVSVCLVVEGALDAPRLDLPEQAERLVGVVACADAGDVPDRLAAWLASSSDKSLALAAGLPFCRAAVAQALISRCATENAVVGAVSLIPGSDFPIMTANQAKLALDLAAAYGRDLDPARALELCGVVAGGLGWRAIARAAAGAVPGVGALLKAGIGYGGTIAIGNALRLRFELEDRPAPDRAASPAPERRPAAGLGAPAPADDYVTIGGGRA
ncbi:DUF697 domain-containing protein [Olsenella sp. An293]|uniref:DUF697 domain-containing protein n=1 Tax=Olsenella sp. An293 TaxID=1965626 RepID=UPI000B3850F8|nr:DUF697 domain-containing protein [Olsenella sp. An293]OUO32701.1 hypothetical protein B5F85_05370 [Olsenella sp. An293]